MTNNEIINNTASVLYAENLDDILMNDGTIGLHTYNEWRKLGYQVQKGERAKAKVKLWKKVRRKKAKLDKDAKSDDEYETKFIMTNASLFDLTQVKPIEKGDE